MIKKEKFQCDKQMKTINITRNYAHILLYLFYFYDLFLYKSYLKKYSNTISNTKMQSVKYLLQEKKEEGEKENILIKVVLLFSGISS